MLSPKLQQQVSNLWDTFWTGGITNPLPAIEQITYLIFLKRLEALDEQRQADGRLSLYGPRLHCELEHHPQDSLEQEAPPDVGYCKGHGTCRWRYLRRLSKTTDVESKREITPYDHMNSYVFPWLRVLHETLRSLNHNPNGSGLLGAPMEDAFFQFPKEKIFLFQRAIDMVEELFAGVSQAGADDIMGDIFEFLLSEITTSGKNGQFRTPRHIIRFLIALTQPELGQRVLDPAAGTAGFLISYIQELKKLCTSPENYVLEWDGTPYRTIRDKVSEEDWKQATQGLLFKGYDIDRTMVRIGWMNMVLHGIEDPHFVLRDTLGKSLPCEESGSYDRVWANPPYTGTVDKHDLYLERFPKNPRKATEAITYKTELLFTWLILDLLEAGGKAALIVPEGVLFGSTGAHKELRRQLLFNHLLEGVISLPAGVFNPYTGVKTSILVFEKGGDVTRKGTPPRTECVWFYEVEKDGYTFGANREPDYTQNDLWDVLYKWPNKIVDSTDYYQPKIYDARWRLVDENLVKLFPEQRELRGLVGQEMGIDELFGFPPYTSPTDIERQIVEQQQSRIAALYEKRLTVSDVLLAQTPHSQKGLRDAFEKDVRDLDTLFRQAMQEMLESKAQFKTNPTFGRDKLQPLVDESSKAAKESIDERVKQVMDNHGLFAAQAARLDIPDWPVEVRSIVREFAKLDGYDIKLRFIEVKKREEPLPESKSWSAPVRVLLRDDEWQSEDGTLRGSHDEYGNVRPAYLDDPRIYEDAQDNILKKDRLDPSCIEFNDCNISAGRYKPFKPTHVTHEPPAKLIRELRNLESQIIGRLDNLLMMVEGKE